jgi:transposase
LVEAPVAQKARAQGTPPKAVACYGVWVHGLPETAGRDDALWLRFVAGRPVSAMTTTYLDWCAEQAAAVGKRVLLLVWDNAAWHVSKAVRQWVGQHNRAVKQSGQGVRLLLCRLPTRSPWLNPIEAQWQHGKQAIVEPSRLLSNDEIRDRVCSYYRVKPLPLLAIPQEVP